MNFYFKKQGKGDMLGVALAQSCILPKTANQKVLKTGSNSSTHQFIIYIIVVHMPSFELKK